MVKITEDLIRKRAEHNECVISTLEEISLHQQDIEKIEHIGRWCKELKILYLQSNLIPKIENISQLKQLHYINLALNNIEQIENLEGCESLKKLDLTVNFVGELSSIKCLKQLIHFRELYLTGNPCAQFDGYRDYVIAVLPQLKYLDGIEIEKSERIKALQMLYQTEPSIMTQQAAYLKKRALEKINTEPKGTIPDVNEATPTARGNTCYTDLTPQERVKIEEEKFEKEKAYWQETMDYTPESRIELHKHMEQQKAEKNVDRLGPDPIPRQRRLQNDDGTMLNVNECKFEFKLTDDIENNSLLLDLPLYKHLSTALVEADVQTTYVRVTVKGKVFQLVLTEEIMAEESKAERSEITGHLLITMPKANDIVKSKIKKTKDQINNAVKKEMGHKQREILEVDPGSYQCVDFGNIIDSCESRKSSVIEKKMRSNAMRENSPDFIDDDGVPPLM